MNPTTLLRPSRANALRHLLGVVIVLAAITLTSAPSSAAGVTALEAPTGEPATGKPATGEPATGKTATGEPVTGGPAATTAPEVPVPGPGVTSAPVWFPLRGTWLVGCTWANGCNGHHGRPAIDWATDRFGSGAGAPVYAAGAGQASVTSRGDGCDASGGSQGNTVEVDHGGGVRSIYTHLQSVTVADGDWVGPDTVIGTVGNTGWSSPCTFNHLHFEVTSGGVSVDPGPLLACADGNRLTYPSAQGGAQWATVPQWTAMTNEGPACALPEAVTIDLPPVGKVDSTIASSDRTLRISGWLFDPDDPDASLVVAIRWRGPVGGMSGIQPVTASSVLRPDVSIAYPGAPVDAGFELTVTVPTRARTVEVVAIDTATGETTVVTRQKLSMPTDEPTLVGGERGAPPSWMTGYPSRTKITNESDNSSRSPNAAAR